MFPRNEEYKVDVERGVYDMNNQPKRETFKYEKEGRFCLGVDKVESKEYGTITGKRFQVFDYTGKKISTIDSCKKDIRNEFTTIRKLTLPSSPWVEKMKTDNIWLCASIGKLK